MSSFMQNEIHDVQTFHTMTVMIPILMNSVTGFPFPVNIYVSSEHRECSRSISEIYSVSSLLYGDALRPLCA